MAKLLVLLVLCVVCMNCAVLKGKGLYCRDPDTGKLHGVNTTWAASSFCGNYTCNIRKRNATATAPIRQFNVKNVEIKEHKPNETDHITVTIGKKLKPDLIPLLHRNNIPEPRNTVDKSRKFIEITPSNNFNGQKINKLKKNKCKMQNLDHENDRYLTEKEIESIAEMLHTVKRSDLDAIVDIYKLAQDIYKEIDEMDKSAPVVDKIVVPEIEGVINEDFHTLKEDATYTNRDMVPSYWYDPIAYKGKVVERYDSKLLKPIHMFTTQKPEVLLSNKIDNFSGKLQIETSKIPINYPVTQFQRISSFTHPTHPSYKVTTQNIDIKKQSMIAKEENQNKNLNVNNKPDSRRLIQPSHYLPYPFTNIRPYNLTESRNEYYSSPLMLDYYNRYKYYQPYYNSYIGPIQKAVLINPHLNNEVQDVEQHNIIEQPQELKKEKAVSDDSVDKLLKGEMTPNWKTNPIPMEVLKDIRADIDTSRLLKAFPLRKKIRLERVGKVVNLDDMKIHDNTRNKRFASEIQQKATENSENVDIGEYETFLDKVTCQDQIKLGYFRIGNLTQPFPECCPQLIDTS